MTNWRDREDDDFVLPSKEGEASKLRAIALKDPYIYDRLIERLTNIILHVSFPDELRARVGDEVFMRLDLSGSPNTIAHKILNSIRSDTSGALAEGLIELIKDYAIFSPREEIHDLTESILMLQGKAVKSRKPDTPSRTKRYQYLLVALGFFLGGGSFLLIKAVSVSESADAVSVSGSADAAPLPVGTIVAFAGQKSKIPDKWSVCDGRLLSTSKHKVLFNIVGYSWGGDPEAGTFNLPDLRGRFLRGVDSESGRDPNAKARRASHLGGHSGDRVGSVQEDTTGAPKMGLRIKEAGDHTHLDPTYSGKSGKYEVAINRGPAGIDYGEEAGPTSQNGSHSHKLGGWDKETRPKNAYVIWIIKIK